VATAHHHCDEDTDERFEVAHAKVPDRKERDRVESRDEAADVDRDAAIREDVEGDPGADYLLNIRADDGGFHHHVNCA